ncbi:quinoprotein dehydrogenase-associated SoxYZ-like carrier [Segnochrobactrum spirostomi]|uniref:Quinoprotein dehydrogenase-associated SoxYZ-like carrier n=1 Tax=Segnochrobactrum spirostomi TaxID=2608987 RepID=A0A6A7YA01_9HYPH|nr:quinoprotein dehydrogenase-associated SoxYZ-like carrier [Segnochrobactrum spirostomi]MQT14289.1 quinoprotein dehydrogenase-associated SoxYZ-like carrier [Segnochrobactrum spirostomi]
MIRARSRSVRAVSVPSVAAFVLAVAMPLAGALAADAAATQPAATTAAEPAQDAPSTATWDSLKPDVFGDKPIADNDSTMTLVAPKRAEDAAIVPITVTMKLPEGSPLTIQKLTLIVDENPAPVAATFTFGPDRRDLLLSTRLRVNAYSFIRAIAETSDGKLHMTERFVKASGGCSAPALKDQDTALAHLGEMRLKPVAESSAPAPDPGMSKAQLMIRHPNYSGLQMNQLTRLYIPARFVNDIVVKDGDRLVFSMEGGISLSEDPTIQFNYKPTGGEITVAAGDTEGTHFSTSLPDTASQ